MCNHGYLWLSYVAIFLGSCLTLQTNNSTQQSHLASLRKCSICGCCETSWKKATSSRALSTCQNKLGAALGAALVPQNLRTANDARSVFASAHLWYLPSKRCHILLYNHNEKTGKRFERSDCCAISKPDRRTSFPQGISPRCIDWATVGPMWATLELQY